VVYAGDLMAAACSHGIERFADVRLPWKGSSRREPRSAVCCLGSGAGNRS